MLSYGLLTLEQLVVVVGRFVSITGGHVHDVRTAAVVVRDRGLVAEMYEFMNSALTKMYAQKHRRKQKMDRNDVAWPDSDRLRLFIAHVGPETDVFPNFS